MSADQWVAKAQTTAEKRVAHTRIFMIKPIDRKDGHKRTSSHYLTFLIHHLHYRPTLFRYKIYFLKFANISELNSVDGRVKV
jgi:hypothetical protein